MTSLAGTMSAYWRMVRHNRNFRRLWFAQIISEMGDWFYAVAIYSLLLEFTGKASSVALALVLQVLPQTFIGPMAGVINDRLSRKKVMIAADLFRAVIVGSMLLVRSRSMIWMVYPLLFLETLMWAFFEPGRNSALPNIVSREDLTVANTLSSTTWSFNFAVGSLLGGIVAAFIGRDAVFVINAMSFIGSALLLGGMRFRESHLEAHGPLRLKELVDYTPILEGVRYIKSDLRLLAMTLVKGGVGIAGANWVLLPIMGETIFRLQRPGLSASRAGMLSMSFMMGARGVGALMGPILIASWAGQSQRRLRHLILMGYIAAAIGYSLLGMAPGLWLACAAVMFAHMGGSSIWVCSTTLLQMNTEDRFRGRVFSADLGFAMLMMAITCYSTGFIIDSGISARTAAILVGVALVPATALWLFALGLWRERAQAQAVS